MEAWEHDSGAGVCRGAQAKRHGAHHDVFDWVGKDKHEGLGKANVSLLFFLTMSASTCSIIIRGMFTDCSLFAGGVGDVHILLAAYWRHPPARHGRRGRASHSCTGAAT